MIILLIVVAAVGQLLYQWKSGDAATSGAIGAASDDGAGEAAQESGHSGLGWYLSTFLLVVIPFAYMRIPEWVVSMASLGDGGLRWVKLTSAAVLILLFEPMMRKNHVGGMLALPIFFAAQLEDMGFYATAPLFIIGVMYLMGERLKTPPP